MSPYHTSFQPNKLCKPQLKSFYRTQGPRIPFNQIHHSLKHAPNIRDIICPKIISSEIPHLLCRLTYKIKVQQGLFCWCTQKNLWYLNLLRNIRDALDDTIS